MTSETETVFLASSEFDSKMALCARTIPSGPQRSLASFFVEEAVRCARLAARLRRLRFSEEK